MRKCTSVNHKILEETFNVNIQDKNGRTPLHMATEKNNLDAVRLFMTCKPDLCIRNDMGDTCLHVASVMKDIRPEIIQELLKTRLCLNLQNNEGLTPLHLATINNNIKLMTYYLDLEANTDITDTDNRWTPLHHATMARHSQAILLLLERGANPNIIDKFGQSPIFNAVMEGDLNLVQNMVSYGADIYIRDKFGQTLLHLAAKNTNSVILNWILDRHWNININVQNRRGQTPLHCAVEDHRTENIITILQKEPDLDIQDHQGLTVFDLRLDDELIKHVIKLKVVKLPVSKSISDKVYDNDDSRFNYQYEQQCYEELEKMKNIFLPGFTMDYYKFMFMTEHRRAEFMLTERIPLYPRDTTFIRRRFPIYWGTIDRYFLDSHERSRELHKLENKMNIIFNLPNLCVSKILAYLPTGDLRILLKAFKSLHSMQ